jgi:hypothetical protein
LQALDAVHEVIEVGGLVEGGRRPGAPVVGTRPPLVGRLGALQAETNVTMKPMIGTRTMRSHQPLCPASWIRSRDLARRSRLDVGRSK